MHAPKLLWLSWIAVPLLTVINQSCMKLLAEQLVANDSFVVIIHSPYSIGIFVSEIISFVLWLRVLSVVPVGRAVPISAIAYVLVLLVGWLGFREPLYPVQLLGSILILVGVFLLAIPSHSQKVAPV